MNDDSSSTEFDEFVRARTPALLRSAYLLTGDQHLAEDLVQSALVRTHRSWKRIHRVSNAEAYTRKIMYHLQVAWWRRRRFHEQYGDDLPAHTQSTPDSSEDVARKLLLRHALSRLTAKQRAVVVLRFYEDRSVADTAELLGCSIGTVKSQTAKAINALRQQHLDVAQFTERSFA
ncbi:MAG: SigE family RNA polymerase sigma factor [Stackebrandtia sp.]